MELKAKRRLSMKWVVVRESFHLLRNDHQVFNFRGFFPPFYGDASVKKRSIGQTHHQVKNGRNYSDTSFVILVIF